MRHPITSWPYEQITDFFYLCYIQQKLYVNNIKYKRWLGCATLSVIRVPGAVDQS